MSKASGQSQGEGLTLLEVTEIFAEEEALHGLRSCAGRPARAALTVALLTCNATTSSTKVKRTVVGSVPIRPVFTVRIGTVMQGPHLKHGEWAIGIYLYPANIKGMSLMQLHRVLVILQKAAWFLLHCLRTATEKGKALFSGPVEADETYISGKGKNMSNQQRKELKGSERGPVGQTAVVGLKDHATNKMAAQPVYTLGLKSFKVWGAPTEGRCKALQTKPKPMRGWVSLSMRR